MALWLRVESATPATFRFGPFELDVAAYQLRQDGQPVRLERRPMDLLILLVERRGTLVTRAEIVERLWGPDVFIEVETSVHTAIRKVRQALQDSAEAPRFLETVPGKGYRFVGEVIADQRQAPPVSQVVPSADAPSPAAPHGPAGRPWDWRLVLAAAVILALAVAAWAGWSALWPRKAADAPVRLAILPFANLSADPGVEYLADGLTEETIASLGQVDPEHLEVVGRTSMMSYKRDPPPLSEIGSAVGADYLIESAVRVEGARVRVTSRLIRGRDQVQVWAETYDRDASDTLGLQQELSRAIAAQVERRLAPDDLQALERRQTQSAEAYDLYLRSRDYARQRTPLSNRRAVEYLEQAVRVDDAYALAWSALSHTLAAMPVNSDMSPEAVRPRATEAARRAIDADPRLAEAQVARAYVDWMLEWEWARAEAGLRRALELDPSHSFARLILAHALSQQGRHDEARDQAARARDFDPLSALHFALSSQVAYQAGDPEQAGELARRAIALEPNLWIGHMMLGQALDGRGQPEPALEALATAARLSDQNSKPLSLRAWVLARNGRAAEAREVLGALEAASAHRYVPPYALALAHAGLGDVEAALAWLERGAGGRDVHMMYLTVDPKWAELRGDPRFAAILRRCGFHTGSQAVR